MLVTIALVVVVVVTVGVMVVVVFRVMGVVVFMVRLWLWLWSWLWFWIGRGAELRQSNESVPNESVANTKRSLGSQRERIRGVVEQEPAFKLALR